MKRLSLVLIDKDILKLKNLRKPFENKQTQTDDFLRGIFFSDA